MDNAVQKPNGNNLKDEIAIEILVTYFFVKNKYFFQKFLIMPSDALEKL